MLPAEKVLDLYFLDARCMLIEIAALLDRYDRAVQGQPGEVPSSTDRLDSIYQALTLLAERDVQIAELQQAVVELANQNDERASAAVRPGLAAAQQQIARLEAKLFEQERTMRQTLTMLIEWIETEMDQTKAA